MMVSGLYGFISSLCTYAGSMSIKKVQTHITRIPGHFSPFKMVSGLLLRTRIPNIILTYFFLLDTIEGENAVEFWQRQNKNDEEILINDETERRTEEIKLYCQSCCYRYPQECLFLDTLHPHDRSAESCPDFVPKDMYKGITRAECWKKRLGIEPNHKPLPDNLVFHPIYSPFILCDSTNYFMILTKKKAIDFVEEKI